MLLHTRCRGSVLIIAMVMLLLILLLGVSMTNIGMLSEKAARNERDRKIALLAAEAALIDAELDLSNASDSQSRSAIFSAHSTEGFIAECSRGNQHLYQGLCNSLNGQRTWQIVDFMAGSKDPVTVEFGCFTGQNMAVGNGPFPVKLPRYLIELTLDNAPGNLTYPHYLYRITAIGYGNHVNTKAVIQSYYRKDD